MVWQDLEIFVFYQFFVELPLGGGVFLFKPINGSLPTLDELELCSGLFHFFQNSSKYIISFTLIFSNKMASIIIEYFQVQLRGTHEEFCKPECHKVHSQVDDTTMKIPKNILTVLVRSSSSLVISNQSWLIHFFPLLEDVPEHELFYLKNKNDRSFSDSLSLFV